MTDQNQPLTDTEIITPDRDDQLVIPTGGDADGTDGGDADGIDGGDADGTDGGDADGTDA